MRCVSQTKTRGGGGVLSRTTGFSFSVQFDDSCCQSAFHFARTHAREPAAYVILLPSANKMAPCARRRFGSIVWLRHIHPGTSRVQCVQYRSSAPCVCLSPSAVAILSRGVWCLYHETARSCDSPSFPLFSHCFAGTMHPHAMTFLALSVALVYVAEAGRLGIATKLRSMNGVFSITSASGLLTSGALHRLQRLGSFCWPYSFAGLSRGLPVSCVAGERTACCGWLPSSPAVV